MNLAINQETEDLCNQTDRSEGKNGMQNHQTTLGNILSKVSYRTVLEIGCGDIDVYGEITRNMKSSGHLSAAYIGFNQESSIFSQLKSTYDQKKAEGLTSAASLFLERDIFSLEEKGCYFDLICVTDPTYQKKIQDVEELQIMLEKAFRHSRNLILRGVTLEDASSACDTSCDPVEVFSQRIPRDHFFPLRVYADIAKKYKKNTEVHTGPLYIHQGSETRTSYLLFS